MPGTLLRANRGIFSLPVKILEQTFKLRCHSNQKERQVRKRGIEVRFRN
jgi:hypothetical protein